MENIGIKVDGFTELANAIVAQAVRDYESSLSKYLKTGAYEDKKKMKKDEAFFSSQWFETISNLNGEYLVNGIRQKVRKELDKKGGEE